MCTVQENGSVLYGGGETLETEPCSFFSSSCPLSPSWAKVFIVIFHLLLPWFSHPSLSNLYSLELFSMNTMWSHLFPSYFHSWAECALKEPDSSFKSGFQIRAVAKDFFLSCFYSSFSTWEAMSALDGESWCVEKSGLPHIGPETPGPVSYLCPRVFPCPESWFLVRSLTFTFYKQELSRLKAYYLFSHVFLRHQLAMKIQVFLPWDFVCSQSSWLHLDIIVKCSSLLDYCYTYIFS